MLSQLMMLFGFFALVLVSVYWVNRAVVLFDRLIADGQSIFVFFEFTMLSLPAVIKLILPIACFAAATYVTNRLSSESELTVMQATGFSPWRLARPILNFGLVIGVLMAALSLYLVPTSMTQLEFREREISETATARLLTEGTFIHPSRNITFYIRDMDANGVLRDVFLSDRSDKDQTIIYTADEAYLVNDESGPKLIMVDGLAQIQTVNDGRLFTTNFSDFSYDISAFLSHGSSRHRALERSSTYDLWSDPAGMSEKLRLGEGWIAAELHGRIAQILMCIVAALVGFATLLLGGFSRFGVWQQVVLAFVILVILEAMKNGVSDPVRKDATQWLLMYVPALIGFSIVWLMLLSRAHPIRLRRRSPL